MDAAMTPTTPGPDRFVSLVEIQRAWVRRGGMEFSFRVHRALAQLSAERFRRVDLWRAARLRWERGHLEALARWARAEGPEGQRPRWLAAG